MYVIYWWVVYISMLHPFSHPIPVYEFHSLYYYAFRMTAKCSRYNNQPIPYAGQNTHTQSAQQAVYHMHKDILLVFKYDDLRNVCIRIRPNELEHIWHRQKQQQQGNLNQTIHHLASIIHIKLGRPATARIHIYIIFSPPVHRVAATLSAAASHKHD